MNDKLGIVVVTSAFALAILAVCFAVSEIAYALSQWAQGQ